MIVAGILACRTPSTRTPPPEPQPYVLVLGTAQDGGLPQIGCDAANCRAARTDPARARLVTSLLLCDPRDGRRWLFDCTPDIAEQIERARGHPPARAAAGARPALFDGLFLTHAHMGHYGGLLALGREAYAAQQVSTWVTPRFARFLGENGPWSLLVEERRIVLHELVEGKSVELAPDLFVVPFRVPHRDEFSDTVGFEIHGPNRMLVYLPDIDKWPAWDAFERSTAEHDESRGRIEDLIARCDFALLDGCFYADGEIPGRSMRDIPHPFISESIVRFRKLRADERAKIFFTHLNHTNPAAEKRSPAWHTVLATGMQVLEEGQRFGL